jgi:hypothetical protein
LHVLATESSPESRDGAARALFDNLTEWAPRYLLREFHRFFRDLGHDPSDLIDDAIQHLLTTASVGRSRFRGTTHSSAMAWCKAVLRNYLMTEINRSMRHVRTAELAEIPCESADALGVSPIAVRELARLVEAELRRTRRLRDASSLFGAFYCFLEHRLGTAALALVPRARADPSPRAPSGRGDPRDRIRKQRQRGREAAVAVLRSLAASSPLPSMVGQLYFLLARQPNDEGSG